MLMIILGVFLFFQQQTSPADLASPLLEEKRQADLLHSSGKFEEASKAYRKLLEKDPNNKLVWMRLGTSLALAKKPEEAIIVYKKLAENYPNDSEVLGGLSYGYIALKQYNEAKIAAEQAIAINPSHHAAYSYLANAENKLGHLTSAATAYKKALEINPRVASWYLALTDLYLATNQSDEIEPLLIRGATFAPNDFLIRARLAQVYLKKEAFEEAAVHLGRAVVIKADHPFTWFNLGVAELQLSRYDSASDAFAKGLKLMPSDAQAWSMKCQAEIYQFHAETAISDATEYLRLSSSSERHYPYILLVVWMGNRLLDKNAEADFAVKEMSEKVDASSWTAEIARYISKKISREEFLLRATNVDQKTEANAYIGIDLVLSGQKSLALPYLNWVKQNGNKKFVEYKLALTFLNR